jgi:hypothetical protein
MAIDRGSPQSTLNCSTSGALHTLQQMETGNTKSPTKPRLLTSQTQRQRSQRGVALQSVSQHLRSFSADLIGYKDTPEWRDPNTNSAKQLQWATLPTGATIALASR